MSILTKVPAFTQPIPIIKNATNAGSYHSISFDLTHPYASEPLVKLSDYGIASESYYARTDGQNVPYVRKIDGALEHVWVRQSIAKELVEVNDLLREFGVEVFAWDGYRPIQCQRGLWKHFSELAIERFPDSPDERMDYILKFVSDPTNFNESDPTTWPVHIGGGAIDKTLRIIKTGELLDMGVGFDEASERAQSDYYERQLLAGKISERNPCLLNRRLQHWAMKAKGFNNYPGENWHWDKWDQMYVLHATLNGDLCRPEKAYYGYVNSPETCHS